MHALAQILSAYKPCRRLGALALVVALAGCSAFSPAANPDLFVKASPVPAAAQPVKKANEADDAVVQAKHEESAAIELPVHFGKPLAVGEKAPLVDKSASATALTFDQAVSTTLTADPKIRAGLESIVQARGDLLTSSLLPNPVLLVDGLMLPTRPISPERTSGPTQTDVFLSMPIDWCLFGRRAAAMASGRLGVRQSEFDYADLIRQRVLTTATAFYDVVEAKELLALAQQDLENLKKIEAITEKAVKGGNRPLVELNRTRLERLKSAQGVRDAETILATNRAKLRALFGRTDSDPDFDVAANLEVPLTGASVPLEEAYALALENRPDIQSLRTLVAKADADVVVEERKKYPDISPAFGFTRQFQGQALNQQNADTWNVSVTTFVPFFNRNQGNRLKAQSVALQNRFNLDASLADLRAEVTQAYQELETARKNANAIAQEQKAAAKNVLDAITKAYEVVGGRPYLDVLDAQRTYRETYRAYINSRANYWRAVYRFSAAIGKQITVP